MNMETWRRWADGWCPCCAGDLDEYEDRDGNVTAPETIGEGVQICGRCSAMDHLGVPGLRDALLEAIVRRTDEPIERVIDAVSARPA